MNLFSVVSEALVCAKQLFLFFILVLREKKKQTLHRIEELKTLLDPKSNFTSFLILEEKIS